MKSLVLPQDQVIGNILKLRDEFYGEKFVDDDITLVLFSRKDEEPKKTSAVSNEFD